MNKRSLNSKFQSFSYMRIGGEFFMCSYKQQGILSLAFGLGLILSFLFPESIIIIIISIMLVVLSISLVKR